MSVRAADVHKKRAAESPAALAGKDRKPLYPSHPILALQRAGGNRAVSHLLTPPAVSYASRRVLARADFDKTIGELANTQAGQRIRAAILNSLPQGPRPKLDYIKETKQGVDAHWAGGKIVIKHGTGVSNEDVLDAVLFELHNALNPELGEPVQSKFRLTTKGPMAPGDAKAAAEYYTWKAFISALAAEVGSAVGGLAGITAANLNRVLSDPANQKLSQNSINHITRWATTFKPIYQQFNIPVQGNPRITVAPPAVAGSGALDRLPIDTVVPLPATVPVPGGAQPRVAAEQAAISVFGNTIHNPNAQDHQRILTTREVYSWEAIQNISNFPAVRNMLLAFPFNGGPLATNAVDGHRAVQALKSSWPKFQTHGKAFLLIATVNALGTQTVWPPVMLQAAIDWLGPRLAELYAKKAYRDLSPYLYWLQQTGHPGSTLLAATNAQLPQGELVDLTKIPRP